MISDVTQRARRYWSKIYASPHFWPSLLFLMISVVMIGPLFSRGYILQFDMIIGPTAHFDIDAVFAGEQLPSSLVHSLLFWIMGLLLPLDIAQKLLLFGIFLGGMLTFYFASNSLLKSGRVAGAAVFMLNPFVYDRFMAGHWAFLLAYGLLPLFLFSTLRYLQSKKVEKQALIVVSSVWVIGSAFSPHFFVLYAMIWLAVSLATVRTGKMTIRVAKPIILALLLNSWWIVISLSNSVIVSDISIAALQDFTTSADTTHGLFFTLLSLQGFWFQGWSSVADYFTWWPLLTLLILLPVIVGARMAWSESRNTTVSLLILGSVATLLAAGTHPDVYAINSLVFEYIPGMLSFREPQKFLAIVALLYAFFSAHSFSFFASISKRAEMSALVLVILASLLVVRPFWLGADGQLEPVSYPKSWMQIEQALPQGESILVLPWSLYLADSFAGPLVANPAIAYFGPSAITSSNPNLPNNPNTTRSDYDQIGAALATGDGAALQAALHGRSVKTILIIPSAGSDRYNWLTDENWLNVDKLSDSDTLILRVVDNSSDVRNN